MTEEQTTQAADTSDNQSLLTATTEEAKPEEVTVSHKEVDPDAKASEETTDTEEEEWVRPDFFPEQFWDEKEGPDVEKLATAYKELRTKMSQGKHKAPADGKYDLEVFKSIGVEEGDDLLQKYISKSKELGISQESFEELAKIYLEEAGAAFDNVKVNREAEVKKLGPRANDIIQANNQWLGKLSRTVLSESETNAIARASTSADFVSAMNKIRQASGEMSIPTSGVAASDGMPSKDDLYAMVGDERYGKDKNFTRQVETLFQKAFG